MIKFIISNLSLCGSESSNININTQNVKNYKKTYSSPKYTLWKSNLMNKRPISAKTRFKGYIPVPSKIIRYCIVLLRNNLTENAFVNTFRTLSIGVPFGFRSCSNLGSAITGRHPGTRSCNTRSKIGSHRKLSRFPL